MPPSQVEIFDKIVEDYSKNPSQGLKFCQKKLQKASKNWTYILAQAWFLRSQGKPQEALALVDTIKPPPNDPLEPALIVTVQNVIRDCQEELGTFNGVAGPKMAGLWKDSLDVAPRFMQQEIRGEMLESALRAEYWDLPPQLFARLQRESPQNVKYHFAWIALCQIQADKLPAGDKMAASLKMLASRSLKSIVDNTLAKKDTLKILSSSADLRLLYQVYHRQGMLTELMEVLDNPTIGITSDVGKNDVEFVTVKMNALEELKRWKELRLFCLNGLEQLCKHYESAGKITQEVPNELAWAVASQPWKTALNATLEDSSSGSAEDVLKLAQRYLVIDPHHRNAGNALLLHHYLFAKAQLLASCKTFFEAHSTKVSCFDDLKQVAEGLQGDERDRFCDFLCGEKSAHLNGDDVKTKVRQVTTDINSMKLQYLLYFSDMESRTDAEIATFIALCLEVYHTAYDLEDRPSDDACILAIATLMKFGSVRSNIYNLQAACLSHLLKDNSQHNFQASLLELLNTRTLGLGSMAFGAYRELHPQEVQNDTLGHLLYTRFSTLHPWPVNLREVKALEERYRDPKAHILHALQYHRRGADAVLNTLTKDLENVFFDKFYEFIGFDERITKSYSIVQFRIELQRMRRLTDDARATTEIPKSWDFNFRDNRDFEAIVNFEPAAATKKFHELATCGHRPGTYWVVRWQIHEIVQVLLATRPSLSESQNKTLDSLHRYVEANSPAQDTELTPAEREICARWNKLMPLAYWLVLGPNHFYASKQVKQDLTSLTEYLSTATLAIKAEDMDISADDRLEFTHFSELESWYLNLEFAKTCSQFVTSAFILMKQKGHHSAKELTVNELNKIKNEAKNLGDAVQKQARTLQASLKTDGRAKVLQVVKSGGLGAVIAQIVGENELAMYVDEMVESAVEGLEGVLKVKVT